MAAEASVLVVDDDSAIRMLCRINLQLDGFRVLEAESLDGARAILAGDPVDVVLLDVHVGAEDGRVFLAELRRERPGLRVALLTGTATDDDVRAAGADAVVGKPFTLDELRETVARLSGAPR